MSVQFEEIVTSEDRLRDIKGWPGDLARDKIIDHIDQHVATFIAKSPFLLMSSRGPDGREDISPKGDPAGFVKILDTKTLAIPDRPGNRRMDTFSNLITDDQIGLIFLIPGHQDTLRISGRAQIVRDTKLAETLAINGKAPDLVLIVHVEEASMHCPKCMIRSSLWKPEGWPDLEGFPTLARIVQDHAENTETSLHSLEKSMEKSNSESLY